MQLTATITEQDLGYAIMEKVLELTGNPDDAGCDWTTDDKGITCIAGDPNWLVSKDPKVAILVDAANILISGEPIKMSEPHELDNEFVDDILCTALDSACGGALYWIDRTYVLNGTKSDYGVECKYEVVSRGGTLAIVDNAEFKERLLTRANLDTAVKRWAAQNEVSELDAGAIDANDADTILQYALFGKLVFS